MKPSLALDKNREAIRALVAQYRVTNPRVFGSTARNEDRDGSDLDLLVDAPPGTTLMDLCGLQHELESLLGLSVDVRTPQDISKRYRDTVLASARAL
jgi:predicted nucleotidyltransferase